MYTSSAVRTNYVERSRFNHNVKCEDWGEYTEIESDGTFPKVQARLDEESTIEREAEHQQAMDELYANIAEEHDRWYYSDSYLED